MAKTNKFLSHIKTTKLIMKRFNLYISIERIIMYVTFTYDYLAMSSAQTGA